jgi:hypothetical protein
MGLSGVLNRHDIFPIRDHRTAPRLRPPWLGKTGATARSPGVLAVDFAGDHTEAESDVVGRTTEQKPAHVAGFSAAAQAISTFGRLLCPPCSNLLAKQTLTANRSLDHPAIRGMSGQTKGEHNEAA